MSDDKLAAASILALLCVLTSLLAGGTASASSPSGAENRVWAFDLAEQVSVAGAGARRPKVEKSCPGCRAAKHCPVAAASCDVPAARFPSPETRPMTHSVTAVFRIKFTLVSFGAALVLGAGTMAWPGEPPRPAIDLVAPESFVTSLEDALPCDAFTDGVPTENPGENGCTGMQPPREPDVADYWDPLSGGTPGLGTPVTGGPAAVVIPGESQAAITHAHDSTPSGGGPGTAGGPPPASAHQQPIARDHSCQMYRLALRL